MSLYLKELDHLHTKPLRRKYFGLTNMEIIQSHRFKIGYGQATSPHNIPYVHSYHRITMDHTADDINSLVPVVFRSSRKEWAIKLMISTLSTAEAADTSFCRLTPGFAPSS